ncbi:hypothetical protein BV25DRAFT_1773514, partial [Artomyces pyxidatus]
DDESLDYQHYQDAGQVIRMEPHLHQRYKEHFSKLQPQEDVDMEDDSSTISDASTAPSSSPSNPFYPFASEMDWMVAKWVVQDGVGHNSFDRFLSIPGV